MAPTSRRLAAVAVFLGAVAGYFCYYGYSNDHFDRLARARQIAMYGDVPFRDFFDPGYFLTLYASALMIRLFGDNLFGEFLLNLSFLAAGTTVVFLLASDASRSTVIGIVAAAMVVATEPRIYDYDKILFYPLGLYACWKYIDQPSVKRLLFSCAVTAFAAMFRYDGAVYIGAAGAVGIVSRHWGEWKTATGRLAAAGLLTCFMLAPALIFIQATAGLQDAAEQITTYALTEGERSEILHSAAFEFDWSVPWSEGVLNRNNSAAWLYYLAVSLPLVAVAILPLSARNRQRITIARLTSYVVFMELIVVFLLREPVAAHLGGAAPLIVVGGSLLAEEARYRFTASGAPIVRSLIAGFGVMLFLVTAVCVGILMDIPPKKNLEVRRRLVELRRTPVALELLPKSEYQPVVEYLRECTNASDRVLVGWFAAELYFFSRRGFAAGLPEVFGEHWTGLSYQRRSLRMIEQHPLPIVATSHEGSLKAYGFLWDFVSTHYDLVFDGNMDASPPVQIWTRRGQPVTRTYDVYPLPCYTTTGDPLRP